MYKQKIIDGHLDIAWGYLSLNRDFLVSAKAKALSETDSIKQIEGVATVGYPELRLANARIVCGTIWVESDHSTHPSLGEKYSTIEQAKKMALAQYHYYSSLKERSNIRIIRSKTDVDLCLSKSSDFGIVILVEGADFIENEMDLQFWYDNGLRFLAPVWEKNAFGGCSILGGGLTAKGKKLLEDMAKRNMILDIAHMSKPCADESLAEYSGIVINSHTACYSICPGVRQITDEQILQIHKKNGLIGLMLWDRVLNANDRVATLDNVLQHVNHICQLTGCVENIAIGSSMDGGFGSLSLPRGIKDIGDLPKIAHYLQLYGGFGQIETEKIMFRNWERIFRSTFS